MVIFLVLIGIVVVVVLAVIGIYNTLVTLKNRYKNTFSQMDVQLKRRYDLIPNLVETTKGYLKHESATLEAVVQARNLAATAAGKAAALPGDPAAMHGLQSAESGFAGALGRLLAVVEAYPDLKANQNMMALTEELTSTENRISFSRQAYNDAVTDYNVTREKFPSNLIAGSFGFSAAELFELEDKKSRENPKVSFS